MQKVIENPNRIEIFQSSMFTFESTFVGSNSSIPLETQKSFNCKTDMSCMKLNKRGLKSLDNVFDLT